MGTGEAAVATTAAAPQAGEPSRREQLLATAAELFAARGFHGVSVAELGRACGISGPALYKHFASKDAMLAEILISVSRELLDVGRARVAQADDADAALRALVAWHVEFALTRRATIVLQDRDWSALPADAREEVRRLQRAYVDTWADQLRRLDPTREPALDPATARATAHAVFGLINSTPHSARLPGAQMRSLLRGMAERALGLDVRLDVG